MVGRDVPSGKGVAHKGRGGGGGVARRHGSRGLSSWGIFHALLCFFGVSFQTLNTPIVR